MLIHTVIFWLKEDLNEKDRKKFFEGVQKLGLIKSVEKTFIGTPAQTPIDQLLIIHTIVL